MFIKLLMKAERQWRRFNNDKVLESMDHNYKMVKQNVFKKLIKHQIQIRLKDISKFFGHSSAQSVLFFGACIATNWL